MHRCFGTLLVLSCVHLAAPRPAAAAPIDGKDVFERNCALCHNAKATNRTPTDEALKRLSSSAILTTLEAGSMKAQGAALTAAERQAVAEFLAAKTAPAAGVASDNMCPGSAPPLANMKGWNGWGVDLDNSRMQTAEDAGIRAADVPKLKVKWAFGFAGAGTVYAQPTAVAGRLFFGSGNGTVYSLDARTGCMYWKFASGAQVRSAVTIAPYGNGQFAAYFGDGKTNVFAVNAQTG